jgi:hypothetical protein
MKMQTIIRPILPILPPFKQAPPTSPTQVRLPPPKPLTKSNSNDLRRLAQTRAKVIQINRSPLSPPGIRPNPHLQPIGSKLTDLRNIGVGRILIIIAAGPSVLEIDFSPLIGHPKIDFMCVNKPFTHVPGIWPSKFWSFVDHTQYIRNEEAWNAYHGIIINSYNVRARKPNQYLIRSKPSKGFSLDLNIGFHVGRSTTYASMQIAYYMNYRRIYITGVDMCQIGDKLHFYGQNPDVDNNIRKQRFEAEAESYLWAGQNLLPEIRDRFYFCSSYNPWPFVKLFPNRDHQKVVPEILEYANQINTTQKQSTL